jgi:hypothetical protein
MSIGLLRIEPDREVPTIRLYFSLFSSFIAVLAHVEIASNSELDVRNCGARCNCGPSTNAITDDKAAFSLAADGTDSVTVNVVEGNSVVYSTPHSYADCIVGRSISDLRIKNTYDSGCQNLNHYWQQGQPHDPDHEHLKPGLRLDILRRGDAWTTVNSSGKSGGGGWLCLLAYKLEI